MPYPYIPEQNGLAERKHRHILETAITLLQTANFPPKFWFHAYATSILNLFFSCYMVIHQSSII